MNNLQQQPYNPQSGYHYPAPPGPPPAPREDFVPPYDPAKVPDYYESQGYETQKEKPMPEDNPFVGGYSGARAEDI